MTTLTIRPGYISLGGGTFDSRNKHVRQPASSANIEFWMTQGPTVAIKVDKAASGWSIGWRYECGPRSVTPLSPFSGGTIMPAAGFAVDRGGALT